MIKNQKGITLIALVITIIVLLILAGVSIAMLTGENGILTQATDARDTNAKAGVAERVNMSIQAAYMKKLQDGNYGSVTLTAEDVVTQYVEDNGTGTAKEIQGQTNKIEVTENFKKYTVTLTTTGNLFTTSADNVE